MKVYENIERIEIARFESPYYVHTENGQRLLDLHSGVGAFFFGYNSGSAGLFSPTNAFNSKAVQ